MCHKDGAERNEKFGVPNWDSERLSAVRLQFGDIIRTIFLQLAEAKWTRLFAISTTRTLLACAVEMFGMELIDRERDSMESW